MRNIRLASQNLSFRFRQWLQGKSWIEVPLGYYHLLRSAMAGPVPARLRHLAVAGQRLTRFVRSVAFEERFQAAATANDNNGFLTHRVGWDRFSQLKGLPADTVELTTSVLLKEPREGERGVIYCSFEHNWLKLLGEPRRRGFFDRYTLVGASSWSPTDFAVLGALNAAAEKVFVGVSNLHDVKALQSAGRFIVPLPIMACDWVDARLYAPRLTSERDIDLLMVAHWGKFKRHDLLFRMLRRMSPKFHVALVGRDTEGRTAKDLVDEARRNGCKQEFSTFTRIPNNEVAKLQCRARASIITTLREGSCVSVTESFAANTPVAMIRGAHVGSVAHINSQTGVLLSGDAAPNQLSALIESRDSYRPRDWLLENASAPLSSTKLNSILREAAIARGEIWTTDIAPLRWVYVPTYLHEADASRFENGRQELARDFGVALTQYSAPGTVG